MGGARKMAQGYFAPQNGENISSNTTGNVDNGLGLMTPGEVATVLHVDANTVARWSNNGRLRAVRTLGGHRRYYADEVLAIARGGRY
jgi:excisionase family DNA binding protein